MTTAAAATLKLPFEKFFATCEKHRWRMEDDVRWDDIQRQLVTDEELLTIERAALVEGCTPGYAADLVPLFVDEPEFSAFLSIQHYEEFKHFHALRRYLRLCGVEIDDKKVCQPRTVRTEYRDKLVPLLKFGLSEIFTAIFYGEMSRLTREPVLKHLARLISRDEYRHLAWYVSYLEWYVAENGVTAEHIVRATEQYQHQGLDAIDDWVEHWNYSGRTYTRLAPYLYLGRLLNRIVGEGVDLKRLAKRTGNQELAERFH